MLPEITLLRRGDLRSAEHAITQAFGLRSLRWQIDLPVSRARLAELRLAQRRFPEALRMVDLAMKSDPRFSIPPYRLRHLRGRIHLAAGDRQSALRDFADAIHLAGRWRAVVLPAQSALDGANAVLARTIFDSFVETAAAEAIESGDPRWTRESFQAVELNRAASLRQGIAWAEIWRHRLTPEFWQTLARLRSEQAGLLSSGQSASPLSERLDLKLTELQVKAGLGLAVDKGANNPETFRSQTSLKQYQSGLSRYEVLLTFHLGEHESFLWAVTREAIELRKIGPRREIGEQVRRFREAVQFGRPEARALGAALYTSLFGIVPKQAHRPAGVAVVAGWTAFRFALRGVGDGAKSVPSRGTFPSDCPWGTAVEQSVPGRRRTTRAEVRYRRLCRSRRSGLQSRRRSLPQSTAASFTPAPFVDLGRSADAGASPLGSIRSRNQRQRAKLDRGRRH
jgi:tetratricopeptide (TPR) repeat protein